MQLAFTKTFLRDYDGLPPMFRVRVDRTLARLLANPRHPSLRLKKMQGYPDRWEGRMSRGYRFTFTVTGNTYLLLHVGPHDILG